MRIMKIMLSLELNAKSNLNLNQFHVKLRYGTSDQFRFVMFTKFALSDEYYSCC